MWQLICSCATITAKTLNETHRYSIVVTELRYSYRPGFLLEGTTDHKLVATATRAGIKREYYKQSTTIADRKPPSLFVNCEDFLCYAAKYVSSSKSRAG